MNNGDLLYSTDWALGGVFITLYDDYEHSPKVDVISSPVYVYGDSSGYIFGNGSGSVSISWRWCMSDKREEILDDKFWTDWASLGTLTLALNKAVYLEVPQKKLVLVQFKLSVGAWKGKIVYLNYRPGGYKVLTEV